MKCAEITDEVVKAVNGGEYSFIRLNLANGDMVGHTGVFQAVLTAMQDLISALSGFAKQWKKQAA